MELITDRFVLPAVLEEMSAQAENSEITKLIQWSDKWELTKWKCYLRDAHEVEAPFVPLVFFGGWEEGETEKLIASV